MTENQNVHLIVWKWLAIACGFRRYPLLTFVAAELPLTLRWHANDGCPLTANY